MLTNELDIVSNGNVDLTERFVREGSSKPPKGSGLGLSIAKNPDPFDGRKIRN